MTLDELKAVYVASRQAAEAAAVAEDAAWAEYYAWDASPGGNPEHRRSLYLAAAGATQDRVAAQRKAAALAKAAEEVEVYRTRASCARAAGDTYAHQAAERMIARAVAKAEGVT